ncbi:uncharacterized protein TNCV_3630221 [Trichonephila clavipes]|nr:uncharacterized protein TNCV_3630221 [Trichonephila clavipes]
MRLMGFHWMRSRFIMAVTSDRHPIPPQLVSSHVGFPVKVADDLSNAAASDPVNPEDNMVLISTEINCRAKELIFSTWVVPPVDLWYFQRYPGSIISFKGSISYQTAFSRFSTGHLRCMNFEGGKKAFLFVSNVTSVLFHLSTFCNVWGFPVRRLFLSLCCS